MNFSNDDAVVFLEKWQKLLRLQDWDIAYRPVEEKWRKTGDIKIDKDDRTAILLINTCNPKQSNLEQLIIHELIHLKLWELDQLTESLMDVVFEDKEDPKRELVYAQFMGILEYTVNDLSKSFLELGGSDKAISFGRLEAALKEEFNHVQEEQ